MTRDIIVDAWNGLPNGLTFALLGYSPGSLGLQFEYEPTFELVFDLLSEVMHDGFGATDRPYWFSEPPEDEAIASAVIRQANEQIERLLGELESAEGVYVALAWHLEGERQCHLRVVGYSLEEARRMFACVMADEMHSELLV